MMRQIRERIAALVLVAFAVMPLTATHCDLSCAATGPACHHTSSSEAGIRGTLPACCHGHAIAVARGSSAVLAVEQTAMSFAADASTPSPGTSDVDATIIGTGRSRVPSPPLPLVFATALLRI